MVTRARAWILALGVSDEGVRFGLEKLAVRLVRFIDQPGKTKFEG